MRVKLKIAEKEYEGICPDCKEWTTAGDSCCGDGAFVEGGLVTDESAQEDMENPTIAYYLVKGSTYEKARAVHEAMWQTGTYTVLVGNVADDGWNVVLHIPVKEIGEIDE